MDSIENSTAYLGTLEINQQNMRNKNNDASYVYPKEKFQNRTISVNASGSFTMSPDMIKLSLTIKNTKELLSDAKESVERRYEYIFQTLKRYRIKESEIHVNRNYSRNGQLYEIVYELSTEIDDFAKYEQIRNLFVEKLDTCVTINEPKVYMSSLRLKNINLQASLQAIKNAKQIGHDLAISCGLNIGKPQSIDQESAQVKEGDYHNKNLNSNKTFSELTDEKTVTVEVSVKVTFGLKNLHDK